MYHSKCSDFSDIESAETALEGEMGTDKGSASPPYLAAILQSFIKERAQVTTSHSSVVQVKPSSQAAGLPNIHLVPVLHSNNSGQDKL